MSLSNEWIISIATIGFLCLVLIGVFVFMTLRNRKKLKTTVSKVKIIDERRKRFGQEESTGSQKTLRRLMKTKSLSFGSIWRESSSSTLNEANTSDDNIITVEQVGSSRSLNATPERTLSRRSKIMSTIDFDWFKSRLSTLMSPTASSSPALSQAQVPDTNVVESPTQTTSDHDSPVIIQVTPPTSDRQKDQEL